MKRTLAVSALLVTLFHCPRASGQPDDRKDCSALLVAGTVMLHGCTVGPPPDEAGQPLYLIGSYNETFNYSVECVDEQTWTRYAGPFSDQPLWYGQCARHRVSQHNQDCRAEYYDGRMEAYSPSDFNKYFVQGKDGLVVVYPGYENMTFCSLGSVRVAEKQQECQGRECGHCADYGECQYFRADTCFYHTGCPNGYVNNGSYCCVPVCPLLIDLNGNGFVMTSLADGLSFDIDGNGIKEKVSWTASGVPNAWLALDRNKNGVIDDGRELFGNFTPQVHSANPNGFLALAEFDKPENGGNNDGVVDSKDTIFPSLRLWLDRNHDALSQSDELLTLVAAGLKAIDLKYHESKVTDQYGNQFKYRAKLQTDFKDISKWAWDVFLLVEREQPVNSLSTYGNSCLSSPLKD